MAWRLDREPFVFSHRLTEHPALSLAHLAEVIPQLPPGQVFHSSGQLDTADDFDRAHEDHRPGHALEEALERLRAVDAYIMVRQPETHPAFGSLFKVLEAEVAAIARRAGLDGQLHDAMLYLFIASPNSVTPFHIDRYTTFLLQIRGSKDVVVYPAWDPRVASDEDVEHFFARTGRRPLWRPELEPLGRRFEFNPGQALHIPFAAGHHVRNGRDDISISMSIIFKTAESRRLMQALLFNHYVRRWLAPVGLRPRRVAMGVAGVTAKSGLWSIGRRAGDWLRGAPAVP